MKSKILTVIQDRHFLWCGKSDNSEFHFPKTDDTAKVVEENRTNETVSTYERNGKTWFKIEANEGNILEKQKETIREAIKGLNAVIAELIPFSEHCLVGAACKRLKSERNGLIAELGRGSSDPCTIKEINSERAKTIRALVKKENIDLELSTDDTELANEFFDHDIEVMLYNLKAEAGE